MKLKSSVKYQHTVAALLCLWMLPPNAFAIGRNTLFQSAIEREVNLLNDEQVPEALERNSLDIASNEYQLHNLTLTASHLGLDNQMMASAQRSLETQASNLEIKQEFLVKRLAAIKNQKN